MTLYFDGQPASVAGVALWQLADRPRSHSNRLRRLSRRQRNQNYHSDMTYAWLDGRDSIALNEVKINVPVDEAKFGKPAPLKK